MARRPRNRRTFYKPQSRATERLHRLVESLLDFGRMEGGPAGLIDFSRMDAARCSPMTSPRSSVAKRPARVLLSNCSADSGRHPISADAEALSRALWNLLDNAVKYSWEQPRVQVCVSRATARFRLRFGITESAFPRRNRSGMFQKFVRGAARLRRHRREPGSGWPWSGTSSRRIAATVELESVEGKGSTFTIAVAGGG